MRNENSICDTCVHRDGKARSLTSKYKCSTCPRNCKYAINLINKARKKFDSIWNELMKRECPNCKRKGKLTMTDINHYICTNCNYRGVI